MERSTGADRPKRISAAFMSVLLLAGLWTGSVPKPAQASECCVCVAVAHAITRAHVTTEFILHREWMLTTFFRDHILRALMMMTDQLTTVAMQQVLVIGAFLDAKHQLETQRLFQQLQAEAHKDYHPSEQMCTVGTVARTMAASERKSEFTARAMAEQTLSRQMLSHERSSGAGRSGDRADRLQQYIETYCDFDDNGGGNDILCEGGGGDADRVNNDINYTRTVDDSLTLDVDFFDGTRTDDEEDVIALQNYLFAHEVLPLIQREYLDIDANRELWLDARAVTAKRSVLVNAYNYQVGLRARGSGGNDAFLRRIMQELGADDDEIARLGAQGSGGGQYGEDISYYGQLRVMVKALQDPNFFTKLYDTPANVARMGVALQALGLQLDYQMLQSNWRLEMIMAIDAELALMEVQEDVENELGNIRGEGKAD